MSDAELVAATGITLKFVQAIREVESNGHPAALRFEPHIFHRDRPVPSSRPGAQLACVGYSARPDVTCQMIAEAWAHHDTHAGPEILAHADPVELAVVPYTPGTSRSASAKRSETNKDAFDRAFSISPVRAVRASSWGSFQVLGWALLEMARTPHEAVAKFYDNPHAVSDKLLIKWCEAHPAAVSAARNGDIATWVWRYNGARGAKAERYISKMRAALARGQA